MADKLFEDIQTSLKQKRANLEQWRETTPEAKVQTQLGGKNDAVTLHNQIQVKIINAQKKIADKTSHRINAYPLFICQLACPTDKIRHGLGKTVDLFNQHLILSDETFYEWT